MCPDRGPVEWRLGAYRSPPPSCEATHYRGGKFDVATGGREDHGPHFNLAFGEPSAKATPTFTGPFQLPDRRSVKKDEGPSYRKTNQRVPCLLAIFLDFLTLRLAQVAAFSHSGLQMPPTTFSFAASSPPSSRHPPDTPITTPHFFTLPSSQCAIDTVLSPALETRLHPAFLVPRDTISG